MKQTDFDYRIEKDTMGDVKVPAQKYWGSQTQRFVCLSKIIFVYFATCKDH